MDVRYSAVATVYNDADDVVQLLDDVCSQTIKPTEFVIADGGSTDKTVAIINEYAKNSSVPIRVLSGKRLNISQGFNLAIRAVEDDLILITAVGNRYGSDFASKLILGLKVDKADVAYPSINGIFQSDFSRRYFAEIFENGEPSASGFGMNHGAMIKRDVFKRIGMFYEGFHYAGEDLEFMLRIIRNKLTRTFVSDAVVSWRVPQNMRECFRQLEVYTISWFQIFSYKQLFFIFLASLYHFVPAIFTVLKHGYGADLHAWMRVRRLACYFKNFRYLLPKYHVDMRLVPTLL